MESQLTGYESPSWWYDLRGFFILKLAYRGSLVDQIGFFRKNLGPHHLEAAIGSGTLFDLVLKWHRLLRGRRTEVTGFDYAERMLAGARSRFDGRSGIKLLAANVHRLPFNDESFDTINVANAIHCFSEIDLALKELFRVLKPGGRLATNVLLVPSGNRLQCWIARRINRWGARKGILHKPYQAEEFLTHGLAAGFQVNEHQQRGNGLFVVLEKPILSASQSRWARPD